jgi:hypothetical protein
LIHMIALLMAFAVGVSTPLGAYNSSTQLVASGQASARPAAIAETGVSSLEGNIEAWISRLAKEEGFTAWRDATWRTYALGPGQHGWVVIVEQRGDAAPVGYLVVTATPDGGYELAEYGLGEMPLFSAQTLQRALTSDELEGIHFTKKSNVKRVYVDPIHAFWEVSENGMKRYADAKTGMWLPIDETDVRAVSKRMNKENDYEEMSHFRERLHTIKQPTDPYMDLSWLDAPALQVRDWDRFTKLMDTSILVYSAEAFDGKVLTPLGVVGFHMWVDAPKQRKFVALEQEGYRFIPLDRLLAVGSFH